MQNKLTGGNHFMNMLRLIAIVSTLALSIALFGCSSGPDSVVLARVNRATITAGDFKRQIEDLQPQMQQAVASDPKARKEFLEDLIGIEVVLQEARRQGLDKDAEFKKRQDTRKKEMERRVREESKNELFNSLLKKELADKLKALKEPTEKETRDYYTKNKAMITAAVGRQVGFQEIAPRLKQRMTAERQRDLYLEYSKVLRAKAKITVDEKALDAAAAQLAQSPLPGGLELQMPPNNAEGKKK
jgi:peptidyl-prolyl cis-trans isomerase C